MILKKSSMAWMLCFLFLFLTNQIPAKGLRAPFDDCSPYNKLGEKLFTNESIVYDLQRDETLSSSQQTDVNSPIIITDVRLEAGYRQGKDKIFPLKVILRQRDSSTAIQGLMVFDARRMQSMQRSFSCKGTAEVVFPLKAVDLRIVVGNRAGLACFIGGSACGYRRVMLTADMVLRSLFAMNDLPVDALLVKKLYEDLQENEAWLATLTGRKPSLSNKTAANCLEPALAENWPAMLKILQDSLEQLVAWCQPLRQDTLHLMGRPIWSSTSLSTADGDGFFLQWYDQAPQIHYIQNNAQQLAQVLAKAPQWRTFLRSALEDKRLDFVGGMWSDPDLRSISGESIIRQIFYGKTFFERQFQTDCRMGFCKGLFPQLPQVMFKSGFDFLLLPFVPDTLFSPLPAHSLKWTAPDGSVILTSIAADFFKHFGLERLGRVAIDRKEKTNHLAVLYQFADSSVLDLLAHIEKAAALAAFPVVRFNGLQHFMQSMSTKQASLPLQSSLGLPWHEPKSHIQAGLQHLLRRCETELLAADLWQAFARKTNTQKLLDSAWQILLKNQNDDIISCPHERSFLINIQKELDWVVSTATQVRKKALVELGEKITTKGKGEPIVVFNPCPMSRAGVVAIPWRSEKAIREIKDNYGRTALYQQKNDSLIFWADNVPAIGYKTYWIHQGIGGNQASNLQASDRVLENQFLRIEINPGNGRVQRFFDKRSNRELLPYGKYGNILQLQRVQSSRPSGSEMVQIDQVESIDVVENGPVRAVVRYVSKSGELRIVQDYILHANLPRLDCRLQTSLRGKTLLQAIWPLATQLDSLFYGSAFAAINENCNKPPQEPRNFAAFDFVHFALREPNLLFLHHGYHNFLLRKNEWVIDLLQTNDEENAHAGGGYESANMICEYALLPLDHIPQPSEAFRMAQEYHQPLNAHAVKPREGKLPVEFSLLTTEGKGIVLSGIHKAADDKSMILRFFEADGRADHLQLRFCERVRSACQVDLLQQNPNTVEAADRIVSVPTKPYEIVSLQVELVEF